MNHLFYDIRDNLVRSYIFYIPDRVFEDIKRTAFKNIIKKEDLNKLGYFDNDLTISTNIKHINTLDFVTKSKYLEKNMLILFNAQKVLNDAEFNFLIEAYKEHVGAHTFLTDQLDKNLLKYFKKVDLQIIDLFKQQATTFKKHYNDLQKHFGVFSLPTFNNKEPFIKQFQERIHNTKFKNSQSKKAVKREKNALITNDEADKFLLETVFNVKASAFEDDI